MVIEEELLTVAQRALDLHQPPQRVVMVVPVGAVRQLRGEAAAHHVVLGAGGLAQGIGDAGQVAVAVVGVFGALPRAVDLGSHLTQRVPLLMVGGTHGIGDGGGAVGQVGMLVGEGRGAVRPGDAQRVTAGIAFDLPVLVVRAVESHRKARGIPLDGPVSAVWQGLADHLAVVVTGDPRLATLGVEGGDLASGAVITELEARAVGPGVGGPALAGAAAHEVVALFPAQAVDDPGVVHVIGIRARQAPGFLLAHHPAIRGVAVPGVVGFHAAGDPVGGEQMVLPLELPHHLAVAVTHGNQIPRGTIGVAYLL